MLLSLFFTTPPPPSSFPPKPPAPYLSVGHHCAFRSCPGPFSRLAPQRITVLLCSSDIPRPTITGPFRSRPDTRCVLFHSRLLQLYFPIMASVHVPFYFFSTCPDPTASASEKNSVYAMQVTASSLSHTICLCI